MIEPTTNNESATIAHRNDAFVIGCSSPPFTTQIGRNASVSVQYPVRIDPWSKKPKLTAD
jgi:hypothetical protein